MTLLYPLRLAPDLREKPLWGSRDLRPFFGRQEKPIGEAWYTFEENRVVNGEFAGRTLGELIGELGPRLMGAVPESLATVPHTQPYFPILVKLLFPSQRLSVQVHPGDEYALAREGSRGKTEMWYVAHAEEHAKVALGLTHELSREQLRAAAEDGSIEAYLNWVSIDRGQTLFVPAGTIHAIGGGAALCEIQQNSDVTYRFYDFGRLDPAGQPRELHLDQALEVTRLAPHPGALAPVLLEQTPWRRELLAACRYFAAERIAVENLVAYAADPARFHILLFLEGRGAIVDRVGRPHSYEPGACFLIPAAGGKMDWRPGERSVAVRAYVPDLQALRTELRFQGVSGDVIRRILHDEQPPGE